VKGIINGVKTLINIFKMIFDIIMGVFETFTMVFKYLITIVDMAFDVILTFPSWLHAFALITICISIAYFLIGRNGGKSE
jgi:hypothetical protein